MWGVEWSQDYTYAPSEGDFSHIQNHSVSLTDNNSSVTFIIYGDNLSTYSTFLSGLQIETSMQYLKWTVPTGYLITVTSIKARAGSDRKSTLKLGTATSGSLTWQTREVTCSGLSLGNNDIFSPIQAQSNRCFLYTLTINYTLRLDYTVLNNAITAANTAKNNLSNNTLKTYLTSAISSATNSKTDGTLTSPADVASKANWLNAIAAYVQTLNTAWAFENANIPNRVFDLLHQFDTYNPNDFATNDINDANSAIQEAISMANATTAPYLSAVSTLNTFESHYRSKTTDTTQAAADLDAARNALEASTTTDAIAAALKKVKNFDEITFTGEDRIRVNKSLSNVASAHNAVSCFSSSSIITASGTTLTAGSTEGTATITATTSTGNGYYAVSATKPFTVYKKTLTMNPVSPGTYTGEEYDEVTLSRTLKSGYNSIALPFSTDVATLTGRNNADDWVATLTAVTWNSTDGYTLFFTKGTTVEANKPYILHLGDEVVNPTWTNQEVMVAEGATVTPEKGGAKDDGWSMTSNFTVDFLMDGKYGIVNLEGGLMKGSGSNAKLNAFTAYITPPANGGNVKVRTSFLDFGDEGTALENVRLVDEDEVEGYYATDGRRLAGPQKGIVVVKYRDGRRMKVKF